MWKKCGLVRFRSIDEGKHRRQGASMGVGECFFVNNRGVPASIRVSERRAMISPLE
jgi:hypothetical protein